MNFPRRQFLHLAAGELGGFPMPMSPAELGKLIAEETKKWAEVVKFANISVE
jgi:hypothetical protein